MFDASFFENSINNFLAEDDFSRNATYSSSIPNDVVNCELKLKDDLILSGLPFFNQVFKCLGFEVDINFSEYEGKNFNKKDNNIITFQMPFNIALQGERLALNLLQHSTSISTYTNKFVNKVKENNIAILDTRKTTPGLRALEKYAVTVGGGFNHRLGQTDMWMIKDNHKSFFGGVENAIKYFRSLKSFYTPILLEVHDLKEIEEAKEFGINHLMLDNFSPEMILEAIKIKSANMTYEVSGGIRLNNIDNYNLQGIDAISIGAITYDAPHVDISLKYGK